MSRRDLGSTFKDKSNSSRLILKETGLETCSRIACAKTWHSLNLFYFLFLRFKLWFLRSILVWCWMVDLNKDVLLWREVQKLPRNASSWNFMSKSMDVPFSYRNLNIMDDIGVSPRVCEQVSSVTQKLILVSDCQEAPAGVSGIVLGDKIRQNQKQD